MKSAFHVRVHQVDFLLYEWKDAEIEKKWLKIEWKIQLTLIF